MVEQQVITLLRSSLSLSWWRHLRRHSQEETSPRRRLSPVEHTELIIRRAYITAMFLQPWHYESGQQAARGVICRKQFDWWGRDGWMDGWRVFEWPVWKIKAAVSVWHVTAAAANITDLCAATLADQYLTKLNWAEKNKLVLKSNFQKRQRCSSSWRLTLFSVLSLSMGAVTLWPDQRPEGLLSIGWLPLALKCPVGGWEVWPLEILRVCRPWSSG